MWSLREWPGWCMMKLWSNQIEYQSESSRLDQHATAMTKRSRQEQKTLRRKKGWKMRDGGYYVTFVLALTSKPAIWTPVLSVEKHLAIQITTQISQD
jgi:hypothetical protein